MSEVNALQVAVAIMGFWSGMTTLVFVLMVASVVRPRPLLAVLTFGTMLIGLVAGAMVAFMSVQP